MRSLIPPRSSSTSLFTRLVQFVLCITFISLMIHASLNKGWWLHISVPAAVAGGTAALTLCYTTYQAWRKPFPFDVNETLSNIIRPGYSPSKFNAKVYYFMGWEILCMSAWIAVFVTMWLPKGKDFKALFVKPPYGVWITANILAAFSALSFGWSTCMIYRERDPFLTHVNVQLTEWESNSPYRSL